MRAYLSLTTSTRASKSPHLTVGGLRSPELIGLDAPLGLVGMSHYRVAMEKVEPAGAAVAVPVAILAKDR